LSRVTGAQVYLTFENLQFTASFKERGALNKLRSLDEQQQRGRRDRRVRGQSRPGGGLPRQRLEIPAVIVMPRYSPGIKIEHTRDYGAEVVLHGELFDVPSATPS
jgi:threonine dehydratase